ncbi:maleylpyruvate isomerase N-terminal domain-containing protein [Microlunatus sp. GCM10028923]|uniref:maleylpyruvate isomerase N-terminal domain-containing protein n=1 Tax=Microlunatus sp. GCM10028923 TaxID=3273400 RepID=UPI0036165592
MDLFSHSWTALRRAVADLSAEDFTRPSGCTGWLVRDLVCHLIIDAQDVLITLVTPAEEEPTRDAVTYWEVGTTPPTGDDPLDALIVRLAAAYQDPRCCCTTSTTSAPRRDAQPNWPTRIAGSVPRTRC